MIRFFIMSLFLFLAPSGDAAQHRNHHTAPARKVAQATKSTAAQAHKPAAQAQKPALQAHKQATKVSHKGSPKKHVPPPAYLLADYHAYWAAKKIIDRPKAGSAADIEVAQRELLSAKLVAPTRSLEKELDDLFYALEIRKAEKRDCKKDATVCLISFQKIIQGLAPFKWPYYWSDVTSAKLAKICTRNKKVPDESCLLIAKRIVEGFPKTALETKVLRDLTFPAPEPEEARADRLSQLYPADKVDKFDKDEQAFDEVLTAYLKGDAGDTIKNSERFITDFSKSGLRFRAQFLAAEMELKKGHKENAEKLYAEIIEKTPLGYYALISSERLKQPQKDKIKKTPLTKPDPTKLNFNFSEQMAFKRAEELLYLKKKEEVAFELDSLARTRVYNDDALIEIMQLAAQSEQHLNAFKLVSELIQRQYSGLFSAEMIDLVFPFMYEKEITEQAKLYKLDPLWVMSLIKQESGFKASAISSSGALGLMQLMPFTAVDTQNDVKLMSLKQPGSNIAVGTKYLASLVEKYEGNMVYALAAYNAGPNRVAKWRKDLKPGASMIDFVEAIPFKETRDYVMSILRNRYWYQVRKGITPSSLFETWKETAS